MLVCLRTRFSPDGLIAAALLLALAACSGGGEPGSPGGAAVSDYPLKIGKPYAVRGTTYVPADETAYDAVGYASWYGSDHEGKPTARGEAFRSSTISAAHRTLPLPSYVEVTALATGRTILVRINDRGPIRPGRIIDLSEGAARQLGVRDIGVAAVRVRRVEPDERERVLLRSGRSAAERPAPTPAALARLRARLDNPAPLTLPAYTPSAGYLVQVASFSSPDNAARLVGRLGGTVTQTAAGYWQVLLGPYSDEREAWEGLEAARRAGYSDARLVNR